MDIPPSIVQRAMGPANQITNRCLGSGLLSLKIWPLEMASDGKSGIYALIARYATAKDCAQGQVFYDSLMQNLVKNPFNTDLERTKLCQTIAFIQSW